MNFATPVFDLSNIYSSLHGLTDVLRTFDKGLLKTEIVNEKVFPPANPDLNRTRNHCTLNQPPKETLCLKYRKSVSTFFNFCNSS